MRTRSGVVIALAAALSLLGTQGAAASTEIGNNCLANFSVPGFTVVQVQNAPGSSLPAAAPTGGVITKWKTNLPPVPITIPQILKVVRPTGVANQFQVVGESPAANVGGGITTVDARIPIQAGDHLGLSDGGGEGSATLACKTENTGDEIGVLKGNATVGSTQTFEPAPKFSLPVAAVIEPDADNDGFGDETQDKCPQSAAVQAECPVVVLDSFALAKKSSIVVLVSTDESASVTVSGTVKLPKGAKKASASAKAKLKKVKHTVPAGKLVRFTLKFPGSLKSALRSLPRGKSLTVKLQAQAKNVAGQVFTDKAKLKLKGGG